MHLEVERVQNDKVNSKAHGKACMRGARLLVCACASLLVAEAWGAPGSTIEREEASSGTNHVLLLGGNGACAELPVEPFRGLTNATIECWVRWDELHATRRVFNYGSPMHDLSICSVGGDSLGLVIVDGRGQVRWLRVSNVLRTGEWCHVAAVTGLDGMRLYLNGFLLRFPEKFTGSFATADPDGQCYLGKSVTASDREPTFVGAIDNFRVWDHTRGTETIRRDMYRKVLMNEPGLVWAADFEPVPGAKDGLESSGAKLVGGARLAPMSLPEPNELRQPPPSSFGGMGPGGPGGSPWRGRSPPLGFMTGLLGAFCVMHALLFAFQPAARNHLYFALVTGLAAGMTWPVSERNPIGMHWLALLAVLVLRLFQSLFEPDAAAVDDDIAESKPSLFRYLFGVKHRQFRGMVQAALMACAVALIDANVVELGFLVLAAQIVALVLLVVAAGGILRIAWRSWQSRREGARLIGLGLGALLVLSGISAPIPRIGGLTFSQIGVVIFFCAMSVHLAKTFARANRRLAWQASELAESNQRLRTANDEIERQKRDLAEAKAAAEAANEAKSRFLASVSHELRTPLNAIIGYSEMLQEIVAEDGNRQYIADLERIHAAARHQLTLINDILDLSKVEAGKMTVLVEEFDVVPLVNEVVSTVQPLVAKGETKLSVLCEENVGRMRSDPTKVRQILFNLLSNAAKFTPRGEIRVRVTRRAPKQALSTQGHGSTHAMKIESGGATGESEPGGAPTIDSALDDRLIFEVSDTGIGMTDEQVKALFQPFTQVDVANTRKHGGTGLGLALVRRFCDLLGGEVGVQSVAGKGSTFTVSLPRKMSVRAAEPASVPAATLRSVVDDETRAKGGPIVLVIDDDPSARDLLERSLQRDGFAVVTAATGTEGLDLLKRIRPAAITLDVIMPPPDGWTVLSMIKSNPVTADIPVVMTTVVDQQNLGFALGADEYVTKPIDRERLAKVMARLCAPTQRQRALIVEDDPMTRDWLRHALEQQGWEVTEATNGRPAIDIALANPPDLILLDLLMPEMDGFEFLAALRAQPVSSRVPVIVITAKELNENERALLNGHVDRILKKGGLSPGELVRQIRAVLRTEQASTAGR